jgi:hypothetical protein
MKDYTNRILDEKNRVDRLQTETGIDLTKVSKYIDNLLKGMQETSEDMNEDYFQDFRHRVAEMTTELTGLIPELEELDEDVIETLHEVFELEANKLVKFSDLPHSQTEELKGDVVITLEEEETGQELQFNMTKFIVDTIMQADNGFFFTQDDKDGTDYLAIMMNGMREAIWERRDYFL